MSRPIKGSGEFNAEFDRKIEKIRDLSSQPSLETELSSEVVELCNWINADPKVRRNLNAGRYREMITYRRFCPDNPAWEKVEAMLRIRESQSPVTRRNQLQQPEAQPIISEGSESAS